MSKWTEYTVDTPEKIRRRKKLEHQPNLKYDDDVDNEYGKVDISI